MSYISSNAVSFGEAPHRTGLPVRTIRFYCDEGILAAQSGGHRMFTPNALGGVQQWPDTALLRLLAACGGGQR
ncbi:MerR family transcriptional regulator [Nocardia sp. NPDC058499]|uniref:MerR family transcriptional regulator n=1 Tax=Nocardia sp. NPDC058499 TaxID=3346530 RepID=UPI0036664E3F